MSAARIKELEKRIAHRIGEAIHEWGLISEGDRILVGFSGGKDSATLLYFLRYFQKRSPVRYTFFALHLDQGEPGFPVDQVREFLEREGFEHRIIREDIETLVRERIPEGKNPCPLCSRFRRGIIYNRAVEMGATKIALGHHRDDAIETLLLNLFFAGQLKAMPALLHSDDGRNTVIRPMIYVAEEDIREFATLSGFPALSCSGCGGRERDRMTHLLDELSARSPEIRANILAAIRNVAGSHLLDPRLPGAPGAPGVPLPSGNTADLSLPAHPPQELP